MNWNRNCDPDGTEGTQGERGSTLDSQPVGISYVFHVFFGLFFQPKMWFNCPFKLVPQLWLDDFGLNRWNLGFLRCVSHMKSLEMLKKHRKIYPLVN